MPQSEREIELLAAAVAEALAHDPEIKSIDEHAVKQAVRAALRHANAEEAAIDAEAERLLRAHGGMIIREGADFQRMMADARKILAKKKGFPL